ncbi:MRN complex-interacting protein [Tiliqua scincoides]|uniref:MRN complex-interacting protein n=1 Tax=Tiliqua scincoides TaxID=71010 RepID=UPI0034628B03
MAQQFQVLRCCFCRVFQVQQIKKSKKWNCKMCGEKQSLLKVFGQGSGFDCRCHVQKLNLLQGEVEQAPANVVRHAEEPGESGDENTVVRMEENLCCQEQKVGLTSRWTKYLDKKFDEHEEEEMVLTEKQTYHSRKNTAKNPRKHKTTRSYPTDDQGPDQKRVAGLAKNSRCFESRRGAATADTKSCVDTTCKSLIAPAAEVPLRHGKNEEPGSRGAALSKWEKFLLSKECDNSSGLTAPVQERLESPVKTPTLPASDDMAASDIGVTPSNWDPEPKKHTSSLLDQVSNAEYVGINRIPTVRSGETLVLASSPLNLCNRLPEKPASVPSSSLPAVSNVKNLYRSLFSTDDFDDYL